MVEQFGSSLRKAEVAGSNPARLVAWLVDNNLLRKDKKMSELTIHHIEKVEISQDVQLSSGTRIVKIIITGKDTRDEVSIFGDDNKPVLVETKSGRTY